MMDAQHTPGPWACFYKRKYDEWHVALPIDGTGMKRAIFPDGIPSDNPEGDARLIAAAPEMLTACRALVAWDDAEKAGPDYGTLTRDTHPHGEAIWRRWWDDQQRLCAHAFDTARAALEKAGVCNASGQGVAKNTESVATNHEKA